MLEIIYKIKTCATQSVVAIESVHIDYALSLVLDIYKGFVAMISLNHIQHKRYIMQCNLHNPYSRF